MKCSYCEKESTYSLNAILNEGTVVIKACDEHLQLGYFNQQNHLAAEQLKEKMRAYARSWNHPRN